MRGIVRCSLVLLVVLAVLLAGLMIHVSFVINPGRYTADIAQLVKERSGLELQLHNDPSWHLFPRPGVSISGAELRFPGASSQAMPLVKSGNIKIVAELLPLLRGRLVAKDILIDKPEVTLHRTASGQGNWCYWKAVWQHIRHPHVRSRLDQRLSLNDAHLAISQGRLRYQDDRYSQTDGQRPFTLELTHIRVDSLKLATRRFVPASLSFDAHSSLGYAGHVALSGKVNAVPFCRLYALRHARLESEGWLPGISRHRQQHLDLSLDNLTLNLPEGKYHAGNITAKGIIATDAAPDRTLPFDGRMDLAIDAANRSAIATGIRLHSGDQVAVNGLFKLSGAKNRSCYQASVTLPEQGIDQWLKHQGIDISDWPMAKRVVEHAIDNAQRKQVGNQVMLTSGCTPG